jgi:hypothetical protein
MQTPRGHFRCARFAAHSAPYLQPLSPAPLSSQSAQVEQENLSSSRGPLEGRPIAEHFICASTRSGRPVVDVWSWLMTDLDAPGVTGPPSFLRQICLCAAPERVLAGLRKAAIRTPVWNCRACARARGLDKGEAIVPRRDVAQAQFALREAPCLRGQDKAN